MGRHSRRGPAPRSNATDTTAGRKGRDGRAGSRDDRTGERREDLPGPRRAPGAPQAQEQGRQPLPGRSPADGAQGYGAPYGNRPETPAHGTPAHGVPRLPEGWLPQGTPPQGSPRLPDGTPGHGVPRLPDGTPAQGVPRARGGHPEQREPGGGWGTLNGRTAAGSGYGGPADGRAPLPRQRQAPPGGPRQDYLDAFTADAGHFPPRPPASRTRTPEAGHPAGPYAGITDWNGAPATGVRADARDTRADDGHPADDNEPPAGEPAQAKGGKGRAFTGVAAAAVTTVLAVVVAAQVAEERDGSGVQAQSAGEQARDVRDSASRGDEREKPAAPAAPSPRPLTYEQKMDKTYPTGAARAGSGTFYSIPGIDKAPGKGQKFTYRVDVERGLGLDGALFAEAVHRTLNDNRSWAQNGARTFERVHSGRVDWVITLAGSRTTAEWCAKSGLDTTEDNVSCDSAATERVMINAYRWARGSKTYGDEIHAYRQMLINHEIGHRLGFNHVTCDKDGDLAPVMQQQTKFLDHDGISCRPNPWAYPKA
ncbi:DUF3152 domain-containing protein [Streptomyces sp. CHD11]|uniref:DUF3152 domain-containing protein n=1 Tax=Streptomyces sp. CHD11 TaxID=2741325 RepID=UPI001BFCA6D7|nr:DUF3152 domain-containing protein [Streptomyces sp. CHD11]MBT3151425.1 DUF3152 domain-containing protein [Streptomyces sp. CHD11]